MGKDWYPGCVNNREWRLNHLYHIDTKENGLQRFSLNWAQGELFKNLWNRNMVLKARQLGMSTFASIFMLDACLHRPYTTAGIIDKSLSDGEEKMDKIRLAVQCLLEPPDSSLDFVEDPKDREKIKCHGQAIMRTLLKGTKLSETVMAQKAVFSNGSQVRIGTSLRGSKLNILHVSEFGWVANNNPTKALEILSGGVNAVPKNGVVIMESTHEGGRYGENYRLMKEAMEAQGRPLSPIEWRFFFFPWWKQMEYSIEGEDFAWSQSLDDYFETLKEQGIALTAGQKKWYSVQDKTFGYRVKTEYPSTPDEAFAQQVEGSIYGSIITRLRADGRVGQDFEADAFAPLYVSWDIGLSDYMSVWLIQPGPDGKFYVLDYYSANDKDLAHYINIVRKWERTYNQTISLNILPHDAARRDWEGVSFESKLYNANFPTVIVPRVDNIWKGIFAVKELLPHCVFHRRCSHAIHVDGNEYMSGIDALENYQVGKMGANGKESRMPLHDACSHGADSFRTFVEGYNAGYVSRLGVRKITRTEFSIMNSKPVQALGVPSCFG